MRTTIDSAGRLVIPKLIRGEAGLSPGMQLEIRVTNGKIEIEPAPLKVRIQSVDGLTVAEPEEPAEPLTSEIVNQVLETLRGSRSTQ